MSEWLWVLLNQQGSYMLTDHKLDDSNGLRRYTLHCVNSYYIMLYLHIKHSVPIWLRSGFW